MQIIDLVPELRPVILAARALRDDNNTLARFLPPRNVADIRYRLGRMKRLDQTVPVRATDAPATPIRTPGASVLAGELPNVTPIYNLTEEDLNTELIIAQQLNGQEPDYTPSVERGAASVALTVDNTFELMRGQYLSTGVVSLVADDGTPVGVDFDVPDNQIFSVDDPWNGAGAGDEFDDLEAAHEVFANAYGSDAGVMLTSRKAARRLLFALQVLFPQQPIGQTSLQAFLDDRGLPQIVTYDRKLKDDLGRVTRIYPEDAVTFLPDGPIGETQLGITQESVQQVARGVLRAAEAPGLTIETLGEDNPVQRAVKGAAKGLPVPSDTDNMVIVRGVVA